jgi:hypothetical protein
MLKTVSSREMGTGITTGTHMTATSNSDVYASK